MTDRLASPERRPSVVGFVELTKNVLNDSIEAADTEADAQVITGALAIINESKIARVKMSVRQLREQDLQNIRRGEHPGIHWECLRENGSTMHINLKGGLREIDAPMDTRDFTSQFSKGQGQGDRTLNAIAEPTELNVNVISPNGMKDADVWMKMYLAGKQPTNLDTVEWLNVVATPRILIPKTIMDNYMQRFGIRDFIRQSIRQLGN